MGLCPPLSPLLSPLPPPPPPPPWSARHPSKYGMWTAFPGGYIVYMYYYMLMRDEKEGRKKQARSNKQRGKATQLYIHVCLCFCSSNTAHPSVLYTRLFMSFQATCNYTMSCIFMVSFLSLLDTFSYAIIMSYIFFHVPSKFFFLPTVLLWMYNSIYTFALPCLYLSNACVYSSLVVCVPRVSVSELEVDGLAVDIVNRQQQLSLSAFCDQTSI